MTINKFETSYFYYIYFMLFIHENILPTQGESFYIESFFSNEESHYYFNQLKNNIQWQQEKLKICGKEINFPRLSAWYGEPQATYKYSGIVNIPLVWTETLLEIKEKIEQHLHTTYNSVLLNYYRNGEDSMGWHSDDELELGINPNIASVSFGAPRKFQFKHKTIKGSTQSILLTNGSLLVMKGSTQHYWLHQIPKDKNSKGERINLTFRKVIY